MTIKTILSKNVKSVSWKKCIENLIFNSFKLIDAQSHWIKNFTQT